MAVCTEENSHSMNSLLLTLRVGHYISEQAFSLYGTLGPRHYIHGTHGNYFNFSLTCDCCMKIPERL